MKKEKAELPYILKFEPLNFFLPKHFVDKIDILFFIFGVVEIFFILSLVIIFFLILEYKLYQNHLFFLDDTEINEPNI